MKSPSKTRSAPASLAAALLLLALSGCLEKHVVWSPDGTRAAVIAADGLHFCSPDGTLTPALLEGVYEAAWLRDSRQLIVARQRSAVDWASIAQALGPERAGRISSDAEALWKQLEAGGKWAALSADSGKGKDQAALKICLREAHGDSLRAILTPAEWDDVKSKQAELSEVETALIVGSQVRIGTPLYQGLEKIENIRVAPGDQAVAFTTDSSPGDDSDDLLFVSRIDGAATKAAEHTAAFPDWSPDGRSVVYVQASGKGSTGDIRLATLTSLRVIDDKGRVSISTDPVWVTGNRNELAGLVFQNTSRVRCLRDGRILFNSVEVSLPVAVRDLPDDHEKFFALDQARQATLVRMIPYAELTGLPKGLSFFEVSPDESQVLFGGIDGEVGILTLASGHVQVVQEAGKYSLWGAPVWRTSGEITYARRNPLVNGQAPSRKAEIVLRKTDPDHGPQEVTLSKGWSKEFLESVYSPSSEK